MHERFRFRNRNELLLKAKEINLDLPYSEDFAPLAEPANVHGFSVTNRMVVQPMEGYDAENDGSPSDLTRRRYLRYAEGWSGIIWSEAASVSSEGRSNPRQLRIQKKNQDNYSYLNDEIRNHANKHGFDPMLVIQLTYSGRYSRPEGKAAPRAEAFLVNDHCLTHYICLDAIKTYLENGGRSRGSYLVTEDESRQFANIADKSWKPDLCRYDRDIEKDILEIGFRDGRIIKKLVKVRDIPVQDLWFEKVWKDHPEVNFTEY